MGALTPRVDDILGCGDGAVMEEARDYVARRLGVMGIQGTTFTHAGMEIM